MVSVEAKTYKLIRSLVAPGDPTSHTFEELTKLVQDHYQPKPSVIVERFKCNTRCQQPGETIPMYLAELKCLWENCEFGTNLNELLRDRVVCGTSDTKIQRHLLAEPKLTLKRALDLAIAIETSEKDALNLQKSNPQGNNVVHKLGDAARELKEQDATYKCSWCDGKHSPTQCRFKEALALVFGVKKFHQFVYGRHFIVYTDHKPLLGLLNPDKATPSMASSRMQRWALSLLAYEYELIYRPGNQNGNADSLSRLPLCDVPTTTPIPGNIINLMEHINASPVDASKLKLWTDLDPVLSRVKQFVLNGWPAKVHRADLQPYFTRKDELSVQAGCVMWGARVPSGSSHLKEETK